MVPMMIMIPVVAIALTPSCILDSWRLRHSPLHRWVQLWENRHGWLQKNMRLSCLTPCLLRPPGPLSLLGGTRRGHSGPTFYFVYDHEP